MKSDDDAFEKAIEEILIKDHGGFSDPRKYYYKIWNAAFEHASRCRVVLPKFSYENAKGDFQHGYVDGHRNAIEETKRLNPSATFVSEGE